MSLEFIRSFQAQGLRTAVIDVERTLTVEYLHTCGIITDPKVDPTKYALRIVRPEEAMCAEQILDLIQSTSNIFDLVVIDSVAAMDLKANLEKTADEPNRMGGIAKNLSDFFRKNVMKRACVVWVNQTRQAIGGYNPTGNIRYTTMGGRAMPFFASIRMELSLVEKVKGANDEVFAYKVKVFTAKNKVSVQWKTATLTYVMGEGFSTTYDYLDLGLKMGVIEKKGAWLMFGTERAQGEMKFYHLMKTKPELLEAIRQAVEGQDDFESEVVDGLAQPVAG
jgi:recombination protein RecA